MKRLILLALGTIAMITPPAADAHERRYRHYHQRDGDVVRIDDGRQDYRHHRRYRRPSYRTYRNWDRGRVYTYAGQRYHYRNGGWTIHLPGIVIR